MGSAVDGASIVDSFVTLGALKSRWLSWSSSRTKTQQRIFVGSSMDSSVNGLSILVLFVTLEAWKNRRLNWKSYRTRGLCHPVEDSTAYIRWLFNGPISRWCLDCGLVRNSWSVEEPLAQLDFVKDSWFLQSSRRLNNVHSLALQWAHQSMVPRLWARSKLLKRGRAFGLAVVRTGLVACQLSRRLNSVHSLALQWAQQSMVPPLWARS
jgi:hypothetical protein